MARKIVAFPPINGLRPTLASGVSPGRGKNKRMKNRKGKVGCQSGREKQRSEHSRSRIEG